MTVTPAGGFAAQQTLSAGTYYTGAVLYTDEIYCWGVNLESQLGDGNDPIDASTSVTVLGIP